MQATEDFPPCHAVFQEFLTSARFIAPKQLLTKRRTLECSKTDIKTKTDKAIKHALCKGNGAELSHSTLKPCKIASENPINFFLGKLSVVFRAQGKPIPGFNL